jgi:maltose-binding protein MalE
MGEAGNGPASRVWKGGPVLFRARMAVALALAFALALPVASASALELRLNGSTLLDTKASGAIPRRGPIVLPDGSRSEGTSLGEIYPFLLDAWRIDAQTAAGSRSLPADDLAERLYASYLVESGSGSYDLVLGSERLRGVVSLDLRGEVLAEDSLELWLSWEGVGEIKEELARIARAKGKRIAAQEVPNTESKLVAVARGGGRAADLVLIQSDYVPSLAGGRLLQSLDYLGRGELSAKGFEAFTTGGTSWAMPFYYDAQLLFYNKKLAGTPLPQAYSLAELELRAASLKGKVRAPLAWNLYSAYWLLPFMSGFGKGELVEADGRIVVDDGATAAALRELLRLVDEGLLVAAERDAMVSWFATGQAAYILSGSYSIPEFSELGLDFAVAPYPLASKGGRPIAPLLDFKGFAISRRSAAPVLARRVAQALTGQDFQRRFALSLGKLPANEAAWADSKEGNPWYEALDASSRRGIVVPPAEAYPIFKNTMWKILRLLFSGQMGVAEALSSAQRIIDENLKRSFK